MPRSARVVAVALALSATSGLTAAPQPKVDAGPTGRWEDLMLLSLEGPGRMTFVSSATSKSMQPGMNTNLFRYEKKNDRTVAQTRDLLTQLTVPAGQLPEGCTLTPPRPPYNENPWIARDRKSLSLIQGGIATGFRSPDGPPLTRAELTGMTAALMDHVVEAYQASYMTIGASVEVFAVRYDSSEIATAPSGLKARPGVARERIVIGSTVVSVQSSPVSTRCHDAVVAHIRALK